VMEAAIRTAHRLLTGKELTRGGKISEARGLGKLKVFSLNVGNTTLNFAVINGLGEVETLLDSLIQQTPPLHFVEVMTCPGGCAGGGGQPYSTDTALIKKRLSRMYEVDRKSQTRLSHENKQVQALYQSLLGRPLSDISHRLLHRSYTKRYFG